MSRPFIVKAVIPGLNTENTKEEAKSETERPDETPLSPHAEEAKLKVRKT
jgi:hypothetical protein